MSISLETGAPLPLDFISLCVPEICGNEWKYIKECLDTNFVSSVGAYVDRFEHEIAARVGTRYAVATVNGTTALHIALLVAGVQPDDEVLVSTLTFIAPANAIRYVGAWPVFIDAEPDYWQMDPQIVVDFLERECSWSCGEVHNKTTGRRVRAILPVHILGHPVDMDPILEIAYKYNLVVIEDATESLGAKYKDRMVGHLGDIACFSFNGNKIITTGGGGMIVTDNEAWARKAKYLTTQAKDDPIEFVHGAVGYNYRLTNIQAAIGCAQLELLEKYVRAKREIAHRYRVAFAALCGLTLPEEAEGVFATYWLYTVLINATAYGRDSRQLLKELDVRHIQTRPLWQPIHLCPVYRVSPCYGGDVAESLNRKAVSLPCSVGLKPGDQERVITSVKELAK